MSTGSSDTRRPSIRVVHLCYGDGKGGASIGARRLHQAMLRQGIDSRLVVVLKTTDDDRVLELPDGHRRRRVALRLGQAVQRLHRSANPIIRTFNLMPVGTARFLNALPADIVQMHWVAADTISIREIASIRHPVVWKMPDMWAFSGTEHYLLPDDTERFAEGYTAANRQAHESGIDIDQIVWRLKRRWWKDADFAVVGPSRWMTDTARRSALFSHRRIRHILNPLDTQLYRPRPRTAARARWSLPEDRWIVMFGAMYATRDRRKGVEHLRAALARLPTEIAGKQVAVAIFGAERSGTPESWPLETHYLGVLDDEQALVDAYNAADVFVLPAELDNLPNVVKEATCCGSPCVGFAIGGMPDMVDHLETGYLARPFDADELARGIVWTLEHSDDAMRAEVRRRAEGRHDEGVVVAQYLEFYDAILGERGRRD